MSIRNESDKIRIAWALIWGNKCRSQNEVIYIQVICCLPECTIRKFRKMLHLNNRNGDQNPEKKLEGYGGVILVRVPGSRIYQVLGDILDVD